MDFKDLPQELLSHLQDNIGWVKLNRPTVLNALSLNMIRSLMQTLRAWETDPAVKAIILEGNGDKAFCAGGDVRAVYEAQKRGDTETGDAFFRKEYAVNAYIYSYDKPYVSLIDGIAMGGGLGISVNGSHRIVTEKALLAMPETGIGFFPDVGATTFLTQKYPVIGLYVGLTGMLLKASDALWFCLATHHVPSSQLTSLKEDLKKGMELETVLSQYHQDPQDKGFLETHRDVIEDHFKKDSLVEIFESLEQDYSPFSRNTLNTLRAKSPTSLAVTFRQLTAKNTSFNERMKQEFRLSQHMIAGHDFKEGIRAVLVDKDRLPRWKPATIEELIPEEIEGFFASLGEKELMLDEKLK